MSLGQQPPTALLNSAKRAMQFSYSPYSHFAVGVCLRAPSGELFSGANIENASYSLALCAESSALAGLIGAGQHHWSEALIITSGQELCPPCGACRQRLFEFSTPESICHLCTLQGDYRLVSMAELLPLPFGKFNLESK